MSNAYFKIPKAVNEPVKSYAPHNPETKELKKAIETAKDEKRGIPMYIGGREVKSDKRMDVVAPHRHKEVVATCFKSGKEHVQQAIDAAMKAHRDWSNM